MEEKKKSKGSGLKSRKFWLAAFTVGVGAVGMFLAAVPAFEYLRESVPVMFGGIVTVASTYLGVNVAMDWIQTKRESGGDDEG